jgi:hypothetical protein
MTTFDIDLFLIPTLVPIRAMNNEKVQVYLVKPAIIGGIAYATSMIFVSDARVPFFGMDLSANVAIGGAAALGNVASTLAHDYVLGMLPGNTPEMVEWQSAILGPALTGGATLLAANLTIGSITGMRPALELAGIGAGSHVLGSYVYNAVSPSMSGKTMAMATY